MPAWPDVPRLCFGPGFPETLNACVGWVQSSTLSMFGYLEGYRKAATALYGTAVETGTSPDYLVFPIAFLWRHHLELALKDVISVGRQLAGEPPSFPSGHRLLALWQTARPHIAACGDPTAPELTNVEISLREFEGIDPYADGFRYPLSRDQASQSLPSTLKYVNLRTLHESMEALGNFLDAARSELGVRLNYYAEQEVERRRNSVE